MIDKGFMLGWRTHLDHLHVVGTLKYAMAYVRWLQYAVACLHNERFALIFVDDFHPTAIAVDHLKLHVVMVNVVRHRTAFRYSNMRRNETAIQSAWDQIAVEHARTTCNPPICQGDIIVGPLFVSVTFKANMNAIARKSKLAR